MPIPSPAPKTIRLLMPQWQGGNNGISYPLGARLLAWLAPESAAPLIEVPVEPYTGDPLPMDAGILGREALVRQQRAARAILEREQPDRVIVFGGDCLVSLAPFAWLNERYGGTLGLLWIDAHPDVTTPETFPHAHAMVLGSLLGEGAPGLAREVPCRIDPRRVLLAGIDEASAGELDTIARLGLSRVTQAAIAASSDPVTDWIRKAGITHLAVHVDLDVLDPVKFRSLLFNNPSGETVDAPQGTLTLEQLTRLLNDAAAAADVVSISFAEHMPWDDIHLQTMLHRLTALR